MHNARGGLFHEPIDIAADVLESQRRYLTFALEVIQNIFPPIVARDVGQVTFIPQKVINNQNAGCLDRFLDRFIATESLLVEWEGKRLRHFGAMRFGRICFLRFHGCKLIAGQFSFTHFPWCFWCLFVA